MGISLVGYQQLLAGAADRSDGATLAFCGVMTRFSLLGLAGAERERLLQRYFPGVDPAVFRNGNDAADGARRADEFDDLRALLMAHRSDDSDETRWLACAIASACLGNNHLWQDVGLRNRDDLSQLLRRHFPRLHAKNTGNMKWKKFFYKQLCDQAEVMMCKAPSCKVCSDYAGCFGPEEGGPAS